MAIYVTFRACPFRVHARKSEPTCCLSRTHGGGGWHIRLQAARYEASDGQIQTNGRRDTTFEERSSSPSTI